MLGQQLEIQRGRQQLGSRPGKRVPACAAVSSRQRFAYPARVSTSSVTCAPPQRHLRAGDRPHAEEPRRVRELERAVDPVVVGERERLVAQLGGPRGELLRPRGTVEERIG